jgi:hypothetical protein
MKRNGLCCPISQRSKARIFPSILDPSYTDQDLLGHELRTNPSISIDFSAVLMHIPCTECLSPVAIPGRLLKAGSNAARDLKSVLAHLGKSRTIWETLLRLGTAASEVCRKISPGLFMPAPTVLSFIQLNPYAKAILSAVNVVYGVRCIRHSDFKLKNLIDSIVGAARSGAMRRHCAGFS